MVAYVPNKVRRQMYKFIIDTDSYSGNFERELVAYCTGLVGDCGVGEEEAAEVPEDIIEMFSECIEFASDDDDSCLRPASIEPTPGFYNDGNGNHYKIHPDIKYEKVYPAYQSVGIKFSIKPTDDMINFIINRTKEFANRPNRWTNDSNFKVLGYRLVDERIVQDEIEKWNP